MIPDPRELKKYPHLLDAERFAELEAASVKEALRSEGTRSLPVYSLDYSNVMERYMNQMASAYSFNFPIKTAAGGMRGAGAILKDSVAHMRKVDSDFGRAAILEDTLIPMAAGTTTFERSLSRWNWAETKQRIYGWTEPGGVLHDLLGEKSGFRKWIRDGILQDKGPWGMVSPSGGLAGWLYTSTLGGNFSSTLMNSLQTILTTAPLIGTHTLKGMEQVLKKGEKYLSSRMTKGLGHNEAFAGAFKDFWESGLAESPGVREILGQGLDDAFKAATRTPSKPFWPRLQQGLMAMFQTAETTNRLVAFEGGLSWARSGGMVADEALDVAKWVVRETQFPSGVMGSPMGLSQMRKTGLGRLMSMFLQFPMRTLSFAASTGTAVGSGDQAGFLGRNWGTLGRMLMLSGSAYHLGRAAGLDLSHGLMFGALPEPREGAPGYPFPVPPALSMMGAVLMDTMGGGFDQTRYAAPLLAPAGVAASRLVGFGSEETAKLLGRKYVDYDAPSPDGTFALFSAAGEGPPTLVGHVTPPQMIAMGLGIKTTGPSAQEGEVMGWLIQNRDRIREYKQSYLQAFSRNDPGSMSQVDQQFRSAYPQIQGGLSTLVKKSDLQALQLRRTVPRLERVLDTVPAELRPVLVQGLMASAMGQGQQFLGMDPQLLNIGTSRSRAPFRALNLPAGQQPDFSALGQ
jgi:hypothetical protein